MLAGGADAGVGPFALEGLDDGFSFAVGLCERETTPS